MDNEFDRTTRRYGVDTRNPVMVQFNDESKWNPQWFHEPISRHIYKGSVALAMGWKIKDKSLWVTFVDGDAQGHVFSANRKAVEVVQGDIENLPTLGELDKYD